MFVRYAGTNRGLILSPTVKRSVTFPEGATYPPVADGHLWLNASFASADWGVDHLFIDEMRTARAWRAGTATEWNNEALLEEMMAEADADGYPTMLPAGVTKAGTVILTEQPSESAPVIGGRYRLDWEGSGTVQVVGGSSQTSGSGWIEFNYTPTGSNSVNIEITAITPGNHIRGMRCYMLAHANLLNAGQRVHPAFKAAWPNISLLRFMQTQNTNTNWNTTWAQAAKPSTIGRGASVREMVDVCNDLGCSGWFCIPFASETDAVTQMATVVRNHLNPALKAYVEWANEWWNWAGGYDTHVYLAGLTADKDYNFAQMAGGRSTECMLAWTAVFSGQMHRTVRVAGVQTSWLGLEQDFLYAPDWVAEVPGRVIPHTVHDAIAVTAYFSPSNDWTPVLTGDFDTFEERLAFMVEKVEENVELHRTSYYPHFREVCDDLDMQLVMYEGGSHTNNAGVSEEYADLAGDLANAFNTGEAIYDIYDKMMAVWAEFGDASFIQYPSTSRPSPNGNFGAQFYINDFSQPRYQALQDYNEGILPSDGGTGLTPVPLTARLVCTGHSIPDGPLIWPFAGHITDSGFTPDIIAGTGPFGSASARWASDPSGPDRPRQYLSAPGASSALFLGTEAFGGSYGSPGRASVHAHYQFSDARGYALLWHNLAAATGAQTFYGNFWRNDTAEVFGSSWRNSHNVPVASPYNLTEVELWNSIVDYVNANRAVGTPAMRMVPWLEVFLAIYDAIQAGTLTGMTAADLFRDDVHTTNLGTWVQMATMLAVMYRRHPDELSHSISDQYGGAPFTVNSGLAAQLRPLIWATCLATPRAGLA